MENNNSQKFYSGGFFYNPKTKAVLLQLRDGNTPNNPNKWAFFGGRDEAGETPRECFIREIEEELAVTLKDEEIYDLCDYLNVHHNTWRYVFYVETDLSKEKMKLSEGADFDWIPLDQVFRYDITEKTKLDLEMFIKKLNIFNLLSLSI